MDARRATISCDIDFEKQGRQISFLRLMYPDHVHDAGIIPILIAVFSNGRGPTILLTAGTHGDEHEGQIILRRLLQNLDPGAVNGRIIVMPALNYPAVLANNVISPLDDGNMNRVFPGEANGSPTSVIAHFVDSVIFPLCDAAIDIHSAGTRGRWIPCAYLCKGKDADLNRKKLAMTDAFGAPLTVVVGATGSSGSVDRAGADRHGISTISLELGGGEISSETFDLGTDGVYRVLRHLGILAGDTSDPPKTRYVASVIPLQATKYSCLPAACLSRMFRLETPSRKGKRPAVSIHWKMLPRRPSSRHFRVTASLSGGSHMPSSIAETTISPPRKKFHATRSFNWRYADASPHVGVVANSHSDMVV